jgi:hypothetical protein
MVSTAESPQHAPVRQMKRRRTLIVLGTGLLLAFMAAVILWVRHDEINRLAGEIRLAGGDVALPMPVRERLKHWLRGGNSDDILVTLRGETFDDAWIRDHSHLRGLRIANLQLEDTTALSDTCLAELIDGHDLKGFNATGANIGDATAAALGRKDGLIFLCAENTQLNDAGLALLPLEKLESLELEYTEVTAHGLGVLARCEKLKIISLDGRHVSERSLEVLRGLPKLESLCIQGSDVTDDVARALHTMKGIEFLWLNDHSITQPEYQSLERALPGTRMAVWGPG